MKKNVGRTDRIIRIVLGAILLIKVLVLFSATFLTWLLIIIGIYLVITGILGFCPLYLLFKTNTNK
jgi:uncharacterized membrane protein